jgi:ethanolamine ammonia-lyase small subunit
MSDDAWQSLRRFTAARIALGRTGDSLPTQAVLEFSLAHARARDAVHAPFPAAALAGELAGTGLPVLRVHSAAVDRATYLRRPDLGRQLAPASRSALAARAAATNDLVLVLADGLSAPAATQHGPTLVRALLRLLPGWRIGPLVLAEQARVALGDEVGELLGAGLVLVLIGERPGLSSPDSLGAYLTWQPRVGRTDAERNCVSNIRPEGQPVELAAARIAWLLAAAQGRRLTGVQLKDESESALLAHATQPPRLDASP